MKASGEHVKVRVEQAGDAPAIRRVTSEAFAQASHASGTEALIIEGLRDNGALRVSLVAELGNRIIGHVAVSPVTVSDGSRGWFGLGPISVVPEHQGKGVGTLLMNEALESLREGGASGCVLLGEPGFYRRFGFECHPELTYPGVPARYFQVLKFGPSLPVGIVSYHDAFLAEH